MFIYDVKCDQHLGVYPDRADRRLIPASTFKILNSLIALETGVVSDATAVLLWDSIVRPRRELNQDLDFTSAFRVSAVPHFQDIARRIGPERMQKFIDAVDYGNQDISGGIDQFWLTGGLRISPREQVDLLIRLYHETLPFSRRAQSAVKGMMVTEETPAYTIHAKTGWALLPQDREVGWWVGWVERGDRAYVFASAIEATAPDDSFGPARTGIPRAVLGELGILSPSPVESTASSTRTCSYYGLRNLISRRG